MSELEKDLHLQEAEAKGRKQPGAAGAIPSEVRAQPTPVTVVTEVARGPVDSAPPFVNLSIRSRAKEPRGGRPAFTREKPASSSWSESYFPCGLLTPRGMAQVRPCSTVPSLVLALVPTSASAFNSLRLPMDACLYRDRNVPRIAAVHLSNTHSRLCGPPFGSTCTNRKCSPPLPWADADMSMHTMAV